MRLHASAIASDGVEDEQGPGEDVGRREEDKEGDGVAISLAANGLGSGERTGLDRTSKPFSIESPVTPRGVSTNCFIWTEGVQYELHAYLHVATINNQVTANACLGLRRCQMLQGHPELHMPINQTE
jgi:hypothetical protein